MLLVVVFVSCLFHWYPHHCLILSLSQHESTAEQFAAPKMSSTWVEDLQLSCGSAVEFPRDDMALERLGFARGDNDDNLSLGCWAWETNGDDLVILAILEVVPAVAIPGLSSTPKRLDTRSVSIFVCEPKGLGAFCMFGSS